MHREFLELDTCGKGPVMRDVPSHANALQVLLSLDGIIPEDTMWLALAAGLEGVSINLQSHDPSIYMCGSAFEYYIAHSAVSSDLMLEVTRFLYCWGALEAFIGELPGRKAKVPEIKRRLNRAEKLYGRPSHFDCVAAHLRSCLVKQSTSFKRYANEIEKDYSNSVGSVFHFVSRIRNGIAHGVLSAPRAANWGGKPASDLAFVTCCQRIVLFAIQLLAVSQHPNAKVLFRGFDEKKSATIKDVWQIVHLRTESDW